MNKSESNPTPAQQNLHMITDSETTVSGKHIWGVDHSQTLMKPFVMNKNPACSTQVYATPLMAISRDLCGAGCWICEGCCWFNDAFQLGASYLRLLNAGRMHLWTASYQRRDWNSNQCYSMSESRLQDCMGEWDTRLTDTITYLMMYIQYHFECVGLGFGIINWLCDSCEASGWGTKQRRKA